MIISLDKFKNKGSGDGGNGKYVVTDGTKFAVSEWEYIPEELDFSQVTRFDNMFQLALNLRHGLYLDDWSKVTDCWQMYLNCRGLESVPDMNTSNCINFNNAFDGSTIVNAPNIDVSSASTVQFMFNNCPNLQRIGVLNTINVTNVDGFTQLCTFCPNLTTIEGIDFSGIVNATSDNGFNGPAMFHQNDSLTNITVNGAINFSWANDYGFNALPNLTFESIESILTAMNNCINPEEPKTMYFNYKCQDDTLRPLIEDCQSKGWDIQGIRFKGEEGVIFDDGDAPIIIPYTGETQELTIPFKWYGNTDDDYNTQAGIPRYGIGCNIEVIEGTVEGYTHTLYIRVDPNPYNETINDAINFRYIDSDDNWMHYVKPIELQANPDSQLGVIRVSANYEISNRLPSSVDRYEILFNVENAEYQDTYHPENLEYFNVSFEPTDIEGYTHVAYITYDNKSDNTATIELRFSNGYYEEVFRIRVDKGEQPSGDNTGGVIFDDGDEAIIIPYTGETQELTIPFNWYGREGDPWTDNSIQNKGVNISIEVYEGVVEGYNHALHIVVDPNLYNVPIYDDICFAYIDSDGNWMEYRKRIYLEANPDSQLGLIEVGANIEPWQPLPNSADRFEILFNVENAEYNRTEYPETLENFNISFEPTDIEGYTHVAYITYDNKTYDPQGFALIFSNGYYEEGFYFEVEPEPYVESGPFYDTVDTADFGDPENAIPVTFTEFAAAEPSNEQWYEFSGVIRGCPALEKGILVLDDPNGEYTVDEPQVNLWPLDGSPGIFINGITTELIGDNDGSFVNVFPGDGQVIRIRTLRHTTDTGYSLIYGDLPAGSIIGGKFNSPCAVYLGDGSWRPA